MFNLFFSLPVSGCIGKRYFHSTSHSTLLKEMKKRLVEIADFHHEAGKALRIWKKAHSSEDASSPDENLVIQRPESMTSPELHRELLRYNIILLLKFFNYYSFISVDAAGEASTRWLY